MASSYFLPPTVDELTHRPDATAGVPRSPRYRAMALTFKRGTDVTIAGTTYRGGYWNGPLSAQEVTDITNAGYGARIRTVDSIAELPAGLDP